MGKDNFKGDRNDIVIIFIGQTGSGMSHFINILTGNAEESRASSIKPDTQSVTPYIIPRNNRRLVLIDTPGFDNATRLEGERIRVISDWLKQRYPDDFSLTGIIYLHRINNIRPSTAFEKNIASLSQLCGNTTLRQVHLVTTMWDQAKDQRLAEDREEQLKRDFWQKLLEGGAVTKRFNNTPTSAWDIVEGLILLGQNKVDQRPSPKKTDADKPVGCLGYLLSAKSKT